MRILISGAGGFIGSHLMGIFPGAVGFDNFTTSPYDNSIEDIDIRERGMFYALANEVEPEVIIHCAASYRDPDKWHEDAQTNIEGGINAALAAKYHGAHLVYFQTILPPISSYAISKIASEQYQRLSGVDLTVLRLANVYGPRNLSGPVPVFYKRLTEGKQCFAVDTTRDMIYVSDLVRVVERVVNDRITGTYDVCTGRQTPIVEILKEIANTLGIAADYEIRGAGADDVQGEVSRKNGLPGWEPYWGLPDGIGDTVAYYREHGVEKTYTHLRDVDAA